MAEIEFNKEDMVFGLDIGTRNVVGTVGCQTDDGFFCIAQKSMEHETRAMLDGQIHDIGRVAKVCEAVKKDLEEQIGFPLTDVCIAAAGRVLRTITTRIEYSYEEESVVTGEDLHTLDLLGIDKAQGILKEENDSKYKFYCVGYSVMKFYLNDEIFSSLEGHKAEKISEDIIVTFLPEDVVDGLYTAVERAGLKVANLTLEPIAAINVAIPENFRMLNIALVDVGAGTSDICITRDGSIIAYGMIPFAGDELTEVIVQEYLVDFATAEQIKKDSTQMEEITYEDIMGISHTIKKSELMKLLDPVVEKITTAVADKIRELNGDKSVSATFVVGGGGKIDTFTEKLAKKLDIVNERVALRGEEVMKKITFKQEDIKKDPLLVTPIGICLNYYEQKNNFIMVRFNDEMIKLYDNGHLTIIDAAMQAGIATEELFPKRGSEINFTVNGIKRVIRGSEGESAVITMNGNVVGMNTALIPNSTIEMTSSTEGAMANATVATLPEYSSDQVSFIVNKRFIHCPKFVEVNGSLEPGSYELKEGDAVETRNYYTVGQLAKFMDVELDMDKEIMVNNRVASLDTLVYENFEIEWTTIDFASVSTANAIWDEMKNHGAQVRAEKTEEEPAEEKLTEEKSTEEKLTEEKSAEEEPTEDIPNKIGSIKEGSTEMDFKQDASEEAAAEGGISPFSWAAGSTDRDEKETGSLSSNQGTSSAGGLSVKVNGDEITLTGKNNYIFVDIFNVIDFDPHQGGGRAIVTKKNGEACGYSTEIANGDSLEIFWKD